MALLRARSRKARRGAAAAALFLAIAAPGVPAAAQVAAVPPPSFAACHAASPPHLPARWRATALMMPFLDGQIDVGEFVYDGTASALRATVYGLESGVADLLITEQGSYLLSGPAHAPTGCQSLGARWKQPLAQWFTSEAKCVGETRIASIPSQWWKTPGRDGQATWHWLRAETGLPWRSMFVSRADSPAIIGDYAMTYFPDFAPAAETNLPALVNFCKARATVTGQFSAAALTARDFMVVPDAAGEAERAARIAALVPGLSQKACARMTPVHWPDHFVATAVITPISFSDDPYSTLIYYDWPDAASQFAILWQGISPSFRGVVALRKGAGYQPARKAGVFQCPAVYPGMVRPNWASAARCQCKGVIENHASLSPGESTQIFACPIKWQGKRVMWNWYTEAGRPIVFAEASARGVGAMLADYHEWRPGHKVPAADFHLPKECVPENVPANSDVSNPSCSDCHTTR